MKFKPFKTKCSDCKELAFIEKGTSICWDCIKKDPERLENWRKSHGGTLNAS